MDLGIQTKAAGLGMVKFSGINNVDPPERIAPELVNYEQIFPLTQAVNVEIDNTYKLSSRAGRTKLISGGDVHSVWADGKFAFYVDGGSLYQIQPDFTAVFIRSGLTLGMRMSYAVFNDKVYYCNGFQCGFVRNFTNYDYVDPQMDFKTPMPAGKFIDVFMGCIYTSVANYLYISDPLCDYYDVRTGYRIFAADIKMIRGLDLGVYVGDSKVWFLKGLSNEDFDKLDAYPESVIPHTDVKLPSEFLGVQAKGDVAIFTCNDGICYGDNSGNVVSLTKDRYVLPYHSNGAAFLRDINQVKHYINSMF